MIFVSGGEKFSSTARAHVRKGMLLNCEKLTQLMRCAHLSDIARQLADTPYSEFLPADVENLHRDELEFLLMLSEGREICSFLSCVGLSRAQFLKFWLEENDIFFIKNKIWEIYSGRNEHFLEHFRQRIEQFDFSLVDKEKLLAACDLPGVLSAITNERLVMYIEEAVKMYGGASKTVVIGATLDYFQNDRIFAAAKGFSGDERNGILSILGVQTDMLNITWIYRAKKFFNLPDELALSLTLPARYHIQFETLKKIASLPPEQMNDALIGTRYQDLLLISGDTNSAKIERNIRRIARDNAIRIFMSGGVGIHIVLAYLALKNIEISDLNVIIESVRYDYDRKAAEELLACPLDGSR